MLIYNELKTRSREFLAATGLKVDEFEKLLPAFQTAYEETVAELPGLASPGTMKCCQGLLPAFGLRFTPHIQRKTRPDLLLRPHPVDTLLHLAIAPVAPLHGIRGGGQQLVIEKREGLFQRGGKEFLQCLPQLAEPLEPTPQLGQFGQSGLGPTAPIE